MNLLKLYTYINFHALTSARDGFRKTGHEEGN